MKMIISMKFSSRPKVLRIGYMACWDGINGGDLGLVHEARWDVPRYLTGQRGSAWDIPLSCTTPSPHYPSCHSVQPEGGQGTAHCVSHSKPIIPHFPSCPNVPLNRRAQGGQWEFRLAMWDTVDCDKINPTRSYEQCITGS